MKDRDLFDAKTGKIKFKKTSYPERKIAFLIFLLTLLGVAFFWLQNQLGNIWYQLTKPQTLEIIPPQKVDSMNVIEEIQSQEELIEKVQNLTKDLYGEYAFQVYSFKKGTEYGLNQDDIFSGASLNKLPIMLAFWQEIEKGNFSPDTEYQLKKEDIQDYGTGSMRYENEGKVYTYRELLTLMGKQSDNTAAYVVANLLGMDKIQNFLKKLGLEKTIMESNVTTTQEMNKLLVMTWQGKILKNPKYKEDFFSDITKTDFEDRIVAGIPKGVRVAHKVGSADRAYHDCGLVFGNNPFALCILSQEAAEDEAMDVIPKIAQLVWNFEER